MESGSGLAVMAGVATEAFPMPEPSVTAPITGAGDEATFNGTFTILQFVPAGAIIEATGMLTGTVSYGEGSTVTVVRNMVLPVAIGTATCEILHLELGPIRLDLLGIQVDLNRVVLDLTAEASGGKLSGLLCAVPVLLASPGPLADLLNQILDQLG
jgi:hypothetical protein